MAVPPVSEMGRRAGQLGSRPRVAPAQKGIEGSVRPERCLSSGSAEWQRLERRHRTRPLEWVVERAISAISLTAILMVFLIFIFVTREALPLLMGRVNSAAVQEKSIPPAEMDRLKPDQLRRYLGLSEKELAQMKPETLRMLMEVRVEAEAEAPQDKDEAVNTCHWRYLLLPYQWTGYDRPEYIWQPVSRIHKYNIVPLIIGSLKATVVALVFSVPLALGAAIYVSQLAPPKLKEWLKPAVELLAGVPSVVLGFFAFIVMASVFQKLFGYESRLNVFVAGVALGLACIPVVFSIAEDSLTSVPRSYTEAALALGSSKWQAASQIVLPAAMPGVFAAVVLGFGRAIGETMVVLLASGNASVVSWSLFDSARTITATIAAEMAEVAWGDHHYRMLFMLGALLFAVTFASNLAGDAFVHRLKHKLEGKQ